MKIELSIVPPSTTSETTDGVLAMVALGQHPESPSNTGINGKVGFVLSKAVFEMMALGMVGVAVIANECPLQEEGRSFMSAPQLRNVTWKRGTC